MLELQPAIDDWLKVNSVIGETHICKLSFSSDDWNVVRRLCTLLNRFDKATTMISGSSSPALTFVMPIFLYMNNFLEQQKSTMNNHNKLHQPLFVARLVWSKYYLFTDNSVLYVIAILLNPRFKKHYFDARQHKLQHPGIISNAVSTLKSMV